MNKIMKTKIIKKLMIKCLKCKQKKYCIGTVCPKCGNKKVYEIINFPKIEGKDRAKDYLWKCRKCGWIES